MLAFNDFRLWPRKASGPDNGIKLNALSIFSIYIPPPKFKEHI